jgi:hypothetical protein
MVVGGFDREEAPQLTMGISRLLATATLLQDKN